MGGEREESNEVVGNKKKWSFLFSFGILCVFFSREIESRPTTTMTFSHVVRWLVAAAAADDDDDDLLSSLTYFFASGSACLVCVFLLLFFPISFSFVRCLTSGQSEKNRNIYIYIAY